LNIYHNLWNHELIKDEEVFLYLNNVYKKNKKIKIKDRYIKWNIFLIRWVINLFNEKLDIDLNKDFILEKYKKINWKIENINYEFNSHFIKENNIYFLNYTFNTRREIESVIDKYAFYN